MAFSDVLNGYISKIGCSSKELSEATKISTTTISRYKSGERKPKKSSPKLRTLANAIIYFAEKNNIMDLDFDTVYNSFIEALEQTDFSYEKFLEKLNMIILVLDVNTTALSKYFGHNPSYISKIRSGKRKPSDSNAFLEKVTAYIVKYHHDLEELELISTYIEESVSSLKFPEQYTKALSAWFKSEINVPRQRQSHTYRLLKAIDDFDAKKYAESTIDVDMKISGLPFQLRNTKHYFGEDEISEGEIEFFKYCISSKSQKDLLLYSNIEVSTNSSRKNFFSYLAVILEKGLKIRVVHNQQNDYSKLIDELLNWMPLYMTGLVYPYYQSITQNDIFRHMYFTSGEAALIGSCIAGHEPETQCFLTKKNEEVDFFRKQYSYILEQAKPFILTFASDKSDMFQKFLKSEMVRRITRSAKALSLCSMPRELLDGILERNNIPISTRREIFALAQMQKDAIIDDKFCLLSEESFNENPVSLAVSELFLNQKIYYTYEEYLAHYNYAKAYAKEKETYSLTETIDFPFNNLQFTIKSGSWAIVSKNTNPVTHFVFYHPMLIDAIKELIMP